jgi:PEP-CTERM motif
MRTPMQLVLSVLFLALTAAQARADLIIYDMFGAVGALSPEFPDNPLGISEGDPIHLVLPVDYDAPDLCGQPGKGLYQLPSLGAMMELNGTIYEHVGGFVEVNNAAGNCAAPGDDQTGVAIRVLVGNFFANGITLFGPGQVGETLPNPLISSFGAGGYFGVGDGPYASVTFDDIRAQEVVPEPKTLLLLSGGLAALVTRRRRQL